MSLLTLIPARGGSKDIPRKNIKPLMGKALIGWSIDAAKKARCVDRIVVSTEDDEGYIDARCFRINDIFTVHLKF